MRPVEGQVFGPFVLFILYVELWKSEKKSVNFLTCDLVFCPHTIKKWSQSHFEVAHLDFFPLPILHESFRALFIFEINKKSQISYEIEKKIVRLHKGFGLIVQHNIIRQKCAGCQVTYLPKIDALLLQKRFQTF